MAELGKEFDAMKRTCDVPGCEKIHRSKGYCNAHYQRHLLHGSPVGGGPERETAQGRTCMVPACDAPVRCKGMCSSHYDLTRAHGEPVGMTVDKRFWRRVVEDADGCWLWTGAISANGYGNVKVNGRWAMPHRWAYGALRVEIPEGLELDHLCRVRHCVNPWHLEPVSPAENKRRALPYRTTSDGSMTA